MTTPKQTERQTLAERMAWQRTFIGDDGQAVLAAILNRLGFFADDPSVVHPERIAAANWILGEMGIRTINNIEAYVSAIVSSATLNDLRGETDNG